MNANAGVAFVWVLAVLGPSTAMAQEEGLPGLPRQSDYARRLMEGNSPDKKPAPPPRTTQGQERRTQGRSPLHAASRRDPSAATTTTTTTTARTRGRGARGALGALEGSEGGHTATFTTRTRRVPIATFKSPRPEDVRDVLQPGDILSVTSASNRNRQYEFLRFSDDTHRGLKVRRGGAEITIPLRNVDELAVSRDIEEQVPRREPAEREPYRPPPPPPGPTHTIYNPADPHQSNFKAIPAREFKDGKFTKDVRVGGRKYYVVPGTEDWLAQLSSSAVARENDEEK